MTLSDAAEILPPGPYRAAEVHAGELTGSITLQHALAEALLKNPELAVFSQEVRAREAATLQAGLFPNPTVGANAANFGNSRTKGFDGDVVTVQLSQLIELGGKRMARLEAAERNKDLADWDYEALRIAVATQVAQAFNETLGAQRRLELASQMTELAKQVATAVANQVKAGEVSPVEETRVNVALATVRTDLFRTQREVEAARRQLAALWGSLEPQFDLVRGDLDAFSPIPNLDTLQKRVHQNPELARWTAELAQRQAIVLLEKANAIPDITATLGSSYYRLNNDYVLLAGVSLPIPLFNRNQGGILEAERRRTKAAEEQRAVEIRLTTELAKAYQRLAAAHSDAIAYKSTILPGAENAFDAVQKGYRLGEFSILDVLDTQRTFFAAKAQYLRALTAYHQNVADVERLIGEPLAINPTPQTAP